MKVPSPTFSRLYKSALRTHVATRARLDAKVIAEIGSRMQAARMSVLELAKFHEHFLIIELLPGLTTVRQTARVRHASCFFAAVVAAAEAGPPGGSSDIRLRKAIQALSDRSVELASANRKLQHEIINRGKVETALRKSESDCLKALENSEMLKEQLRDLSRKFILVQEEERKNLSRELHDVVAQALLGINVRLATLKKEAGTNTQSLKRSITLTQKLVVNSANIVHRFARELRPAVLDDLGLVPALHSFMKSFMTRTGVRAHLTVFKGIEELDAAKSMVLYRVAQEALTNVGRHARASRVDLIIQKETKFVRMEVIDDGKSFRVETVLLARGSKRLGLLGIRERVEMVGGCFEIESAPGKGTKIMVRVPYRQTATTAKNKVSKK